jgi:hypothetical protein
MPGRMISEDTMLPINLRPNRRDKRRTQHALYNVSIPVPGSFSIGTFLETVQNRFRGASGTHRATLINILVDSPTPHINGNGPVPDQP